MSAGVDTLASLWSTRLGRSTGHAPLSLSLSRRRWRGRVLRAAGAIDCARRRVPTAAAPPERARRRSSILERAGIAWLKQGMEVSRPSRRWQAAENPKRVDYPR
eukprot:6173870-Pleurochrysis_carterae.AAC.1